MMRKGEERRREATMAFILACSHSLSRYRHPDPLNLTIPTPSAALDLLSGPYTLEGSGTKLIFGGGGGAVIVTGGGGGLSLLGRGKRESPVPSKVRSDKE